MNDSKVILEPNSVQQVFCLAFCCCVNTTFYITKKDRRNDKKSNLCHLAQSEVLLCLLNISIYIIWNWKQLYLIYSNINRTELKRIGFTWECPKCCSILGVAITMFPRHVIAIKNPLTNFIKDSALEWLILSWHGRFSLLKTEKNNKDIYKIKFNLIEFLFNLM